MLTIVNQSAGGRGKGGKLTQNVLKMSKYLQLLCSKCCFFFNFSYYKLTSILTNKGIGEGRGLDGGGVAGAFARFCSFSVRNRLICLF